MGEGSFVKELRVVGASLLKSPSPLGGILARNGLNL